MLGDPEKRKRYDELGANWDAFGRGGPGGGPGVALARGGGVRIDFEDLGGAGGFSDFFRTFFGGAPGGRAGGFGGGDERRLRARRALADAATRGRGGADPRRGAEGHDPRGARSAGPGGRRVEVKIPPGVREGVPRAGRRARAGGGQAAAAATSTCGSASPPTRRSSARATTSPRRSACPLTDGRARAGRRRCRRSTGRSGIKVPRGHAGGPGLPPARPRAAAARGQGREARRPAGDAGRRAARGTLSARQKELFEELRRSGV